MTVGVVCAKGLGLRGAKRVSGDLVRRLPPEKASHFGFKGSIRGWCQGVEASGGGVGSAAKVTSSRSALTR
jgi:hypothetical protein